MNCPFCHQPTDGPCGCKGATEARAIAASLERQDRRYRAHPRTQP